MGATIQKYAYCQCCQSIGCCCCKCCKNEQSFFFHNRCIADVVTLANILPCCICCRIPVERSVFLAGLSGSGKTALLYYFVLGKYMQATEDPQGYRTKGFNSELCTFNRWQTYEFWDPGGSLAQRPLWRQYYTRIKFDHVIYIVNAKSFLGKSDLKKKEAALDEDRMELHTLLNEEELKESKFTIYINFHLHVGEDEQSLDRNVMAEIEDELEIAEYKEARGIKIVGTTKAIKQDLDIELDSNKTRGFISN